MNAKTDHSTNQPLAKERFRVSFTANVRFKLRISQNRKKADKNCPEQFLWINWRETIHSCVEVINSKQQLRGKLGHVVQIRVCRLT